MDDSYPDSLERAKRLKLERKEELKIYPNLYNRNMPYEIYCDDQNNDAKLALVFKRFCPQHFTISSIEFVKFRMPPVCRVRVAYQTEADDLPGEVDALKTLTALLLKHVPFNCIILDRGLIENKKIIIDYGLIGCECNTPNFSDLNVEDLHI